MKNVYIGGTIRSGKSTLARMLYHNLNYSVFELDTIVHSFTKVFPQLGINEKHPQDLEENFKPFAYEMLKCCDKDRKYGNIKVCINGFHLSPKTLAEFSKVENMIVIYLGMSDISPMQLLENIKQTQEEGDWTTTKDDNSLLHICNNIVEKSKQLKAECEKYNFLYFDTSTNREQTLKNIVEFLEKENI